MAAGAFQKAAIDPGHTALEAAAIEALEEAGVEGELLPRAIGSFGTRNSGGPAAWKCSACA